MDLQGILSSVYWSRSNMSQILLQEQFGQAASQMSLNSALTKLEGSC